VSKRRKRVLWGLVAIVAALVAAAPSLLSTSLGCRAAEAYLRAKVRRPVTVERLSVGYFHGTRLEGLRIAERSGFGEQPFVQFATLTCKTTLLEAILGRPLDTVRIEGLNVSIVRLADGRLSVEDLAPKHDGSAAPPVKAAGLLGAASASSGKPKKPKKPPQVTMPIVADGGQVRYRDEQLRTDVLLDDLTLDMHYDRGKVRIRRLAGTLNEGRLELTASADLSVRPQPFEVAVTVSCCKASSDLSALGLQAPLLYNPFGRTSGTVGIDLGLTGLGFEKADLAANLKGHSLLEVRDLRLEGSPMLASVLEPLKLGNALTFDLLRARSVIADGRVTSAPPDGDIRAEHGEDVWLTMTGWTAMDGRMDYRLSFGGKKVEASGIGVLARQWVEPRLTGTLSEPQVGVGLPGSQESLNLDDLKKLKDLKDLKMLKDLF